MRNAFYSSSLPKKYNKEYELMGTVNNEIINRYDAFKQFMLNEKFVEQNIIFVKDDSPRNAQELLYESPLKSHHPFGNSLLSIEAKKGFSGKFSARILSDAISNKVLLRYDSDGKTHRNNYEDIPLCQQSITTPHLHKYDEEGRFLAIKTESIMQDETKARGIQTGFRIFCEEGNILSQNDREYPQAIIGDMMTIPFETEETDPCEGVNFN